MRCIISMKTVSFKFTNLSTEAAFTGFTPTNAALLVCSSIFLPFMHMTAAIIGVLASERFHSVWPIAQDFWNRLICRHRQISGAAAAANTLQRHLLFLQEDIQTFGFDEYSFEMETLSHHYLCVVHSHFCGCFWSTFTFPMDLCSSVKYQFLVDFLCFYLSPVKLNDSYSFPTPQLFVQYSTWRHLHTSICTNHF